MVRHYISTQDFSKEELLKLIALIGLLKRADKEGACPKLLAGASLGMIFEEPSTRTRVSFEVAMTKLGGHAIYMRPGEIHMGVRESIGDTANVCNSLAMICTHMGMSFTHAAPAAYQVSEATKAIGRARDERRGGHTHRSMSPKCPTFSR